jgi:hypothetical protein
LRGEKKEGVWKMWVEVRGRSVVKVVRKEGDGRGRSCVGRSRQCFTVAARQL